MAENNYTEQRIDLVINKMNHEKYKELEAAGQISDTELYEITDLFDLFYYKNETYTQDEINSFLNNLNEDLKSWTSDEIDRAKQEVIQELEVYDNDFETRISQIENTDIPKLNTDLSTLSGKHNTLSTNFENYKTTVNTNYLKKTDASNTYTTKDTHNSAISNLTGLINTESTNRGTAINGVKTELEEEISRVEGLIQSDTTNIQLLGNRMTNAETKLITLNGDSTTTGSVDNKIISIVGSNDSEGLRKRISDNEKKISKNTTDISNLNTSVNLLNANKDITGSVDNKINVAITNIIDGAPTAFDTLKEIADWIATGGDENASTIVADINSLKNKTDYHTTEINSLQSDLDSYKTEVSGTYETIENVNIFKQYSDTTYATKTELSEYSPVTANPDLLGNEEVLDSIEIDGVDYKVFPDGDIEFSEEESTDPNAIPLRSITIGQDIWNLEGGGSDVFANTELTGNEEVLNSLNVDGQNYSIGRDDFKLSTEDLEDAYDLKTLIVGTTKWRIPDIPEIPDLNNYATKTYVKSEIDQKIIYSETEPTNPVEGMIWFFPAQ